MSKVRIRTDGYTVGPALYRAGQVIENPSEQLLALASNPRNPHCELVEEIPESHQIALDELKSMTVAKLRDIAESRGVDVPGNAKKDLLVDLIYKSLTDPIDEGGEE